MSQTPSRAEILVVDNDDAVTRALSLRFEDAGYRCHVACSGSQAISLMKDYPIDLIVTDLNMPCGSGVDLVNSVRAGSDIPIIVLTGYADAYQKVMRGSRVLTLRKPFELQALLDLIEVELAIRPDKKAA